MVLFKYVSTRISTQTHKSRKITLASSVFEMFEEGSLIPINNIVIRRRRARKANLEAEVVAEVAIAAKADSAAEAAQAVGQRQ